MLKTLFNPDMSVSGKKIFFYSTVFFLLLSAPCLAGEWNLTGSLNQGRSEFPSVIFDDDRVLVAGGFIGCHETSSCEIYNPNTGQWSPTDSLSYPVANFTLTKLPNGKILTVYDTFSEIFNPSTEIWSGLITLNFYRIYHSAILLQDGRVLVVGGDYQNNYQSCEIYNPDTNEWTLTGFCIYQKVDHTLELLPNGDVMAIGGGNSGFQYCEIYDPNTEIWTEIASLNKPRYSHTSHLLPNGNVITIAGHGAQYNNSCEIYDFATQQWTFTDSLEIGRTNHCSEKLLNNKILVMGGQGETGSGSGHSCETYNPITNLWQTTTSLYHSYGNFSSEILEDERVLAIRSWCEIYTWNYTPTVSQPQPLNGLNEATIGETLSFSVIATDPDNDSIAVRVDWGDNEITDWTELQPSGTTLELSHSWTEPGVYQVRAQVADQWYFLNEQCHNSLGEWGDTLIVTITPGPSIDPSYNPELAIRICPNPFSTSVTISFQETTNLHENSRIEIYNIKGQMVKTFISFPNQSSFHSAPINGDLGAREVLWDGRDDTGEPVVSGIYFCTLKMGDNEISCKKIVFLK